ncbi:PREDICTED: putative 3,4-dihydroxy-2-butanone kinase [Camelina sativa]|uniref:3,4-dihydroxy-2-butanone kinase n=1 Tax=Camelina sativa TaxID=90675 RepID=A0ABM0W566_CAMSA|nr:PREDICTED: putative 3,4-dihydroxy-2-butanone kinase [Camelina sativa]
MVFAAKKFINNPNDVVTEFIEGLVETYHGLQYLDGFPEVKVVIRADVSAEKYDKVAVISGGGSGHEPAHAGYVGEGMLTAAICGDVFASPPVDSILAGIRAVTGTEGCLLIVKNYTGDRLNFGLAAEQAKSEGYKVETVIVGEDCALPPPRGIAGRRGLAGTVLVHKVAGAAAEAGLSLEKVAAEAKCASEIVGTMGVALSVCTLPGQVTSDRLGEEKMELGLGIHGEPGAAVVDVQPVDVVVSHVLQQILNPETNYVPITRGNRVVLMVNGLGGTPLMELMIAAGKAVPKLQLEFGLAVDRVYTGFFMTSLDMAGFSISIMKADQSILDRLDAPTKAPNWPVGTDGNRPPAKIHVPVPPSRSIAESHNRPQELSKEGRILEAAIQAAATVIISLKDSLNEWDAKVGDGDCGSTMYRGATAILEDMKKYYPLNDAAETVNEIGSSIKRAMGGTSGIIYHLLCKAAYAELKANAQSEVTAKHWSEALKSSITSVSKYGGATAGYRTMLDALIPASQVLEEKLSAGEDPISAFILSAEAATAGAESTIQMQAQAGRSSYVSAEILATVPDPGAMAAAGWYSAAARAVKEQCQSSS